MKSKKALFLASLVLFLLSYTNNYAGRNRIMHKEKLDFISGLNEQELRRLILKIKDIKKDKLRVNDLKDLHNDYYTENNDYYTFFIIGLSNTEDKSGKLIYINKNEEIKNKKLQEVIERSLE